MTDASRQHPLSRPALSTPEDIYEWGQMLDRRFERERKFNGMGSNNTFNGSTKLISWLLGINALLIAAAISGGIQFAVSSSQRLASVEAKVEVVMARLK
jgi:hypothetical protein